jgi:type VI secretion system secreted protein VgrG
MKNYRRNSPNVYRRPARTLEIAGPALPRWTPPYLDMLSEGEDTRAVLIPVSLEGHEAIGQPYRYVVQCRTDIDGTVNANNQPGWQLPANQWLSGLRSRMQGGVSSNHLVLDDTKGKQQAQLASDHGKSSLSVGYNTRIDGNAGRQDARGEGFELRTDLWGALRAAMGLLVTTFGRSGAAGEVKEMAGTVARLTQARAQHEDLSRLAQQHNAQTLDASQADAASTIKTQNEAIRGNGGRAGNDFPELTRPDMVLASAAGIATMATDSTHMASQNDHAITAGRDVSYSAGRAYHVAARGAVSLFAYQQGMKFIAARGAWVAQAQSGPMSLAALGDVTVSSTDGRIVITASKEVWIGAGGSYVQINGSGITNGSPGPILEKTPSWDKPGADAQVQHFLPFGSGAPADDYIHSL